MKKFAVFSFIILAMAFSAYGQKTKTTSKVDPTKGVREAFDRLVEGIEQADASIMRVAPPAGIPPHEGDPIRFPNN